MTPILLVHGSGMEIRQLRHFVEVMRLGSFTRAADAQYITQSALSRSIQGLEESVGGALINRDGKSARPTSLGATVLEHAYRVLHELDALKQAVDLVHQGQRGQLRIGLGQTSGKVLMAPFSGLMARDHPMVRLTLLRGSTDMQLAMLRSCELDAVVAEAGAVLTDGELHIEVLSELAGARFCRVGHPLQGRRGLSLEEVMAYPIACTPINAQQARVMVERFGPAGHPDKLISICSDDIDVLLAAVLNSDAIHWGTRISGRELLASGQIDEVHMADSFSPTSKQVLVTLAHRSPEADPLLRVFRDFALKHLHD